MQMKSFHFIGIALLVSCLIALSLAKEVRMVRSVVEHSTEDAEDYWTEERMKNAISKDVVESTEYNNNEFDAAASAVENSENTYDTETTFMEGGSPTVDLFDFSNQTSNSKRIDGYAPSYTTSPWNIIGKVYFTNNGINYVCSGSIMRKNVVASAAHCMYGQGVWSTNFMFVPGYNNNNSPYGQFRAYTLVVPPEWTNDVNYCRDFGFAIMYKRNGNSIGDIFGYLGLVVGAPTDITLTALGYPAGPPFDGQKNYFVTNPINRIDTARTCSPKPIAMVNSATGGSSGGPWIYEFLSGNYLNGVSSYTNGYELFSPYLDGYYAQMANQVEAFAAMAPI